MLFPLSRPGHPAAEHSCADNGPVMLVCLARRFSEEKDVAGIEGRARKIISCRFLAQLDQERAYDSASIGIAMYPDGAADLKDLVKYSDQAMYAAKRADRIRYSYFTSALQKASPACMRLITDMHSALLGSQFQGFYQSIVELATGRVHKA